MKKWKIKFKNCPLSLKMIRESTSKSTVHACG